MENVIKLINQKYPSYERITTYTLTDNSIGLLEQTRLINCFLIEDRIYLKNIRDKHNFLNKATIMMKFIRSRKNIQ